MLRGRTKENPAKIFPTCRIRPRGQSGKCVGHVKDLNRAEEFRVAQHSVRTNQGRHRLRIEALSRRCHAFPLANRVASDWIIDREKTIPSALKASHDRNKGSRCRTASPGSFPRQPTGLSPVWESPKANQPLPEERVSCAGPARTPATPQAASKPARLLAALGFGRWPALRQSIGATDRPPSGRIPSRPLRSSYTPPTLQKAQPVKRFKGCNNNNAIM